MLVLPGDQWLQFDVGPASLVTGVVTRGRGDTGKRQWVTRYKLAYSNDTSDWVFYNDASHLEPKVCNSSESRAFSSGRADFYGCVFSQPLVLLSAAAMQKLF